MKTLEMTLMKRLDEIEVAKEKGPDLGDDFAKFQATLEELNAKFKSLEEARQKDLEDLKNELKN